MKTRWIRSSFLLILIVMIVGTGLSMSAGQRAYAGEVKINKTKSKFAELPAANFGYNMWASTRKSYMTVAKGKYIYVYADTKGYLYAEYYNQSFKRVFSKKVKLRLLIWGGVYCDGDYFYVVTGQNNLKESDKKTCFRITKYDMKWRRVGETDIKNCNTYQPFRFGSCSLVTAGDSLFVKTCRLVYGETDKTGKWGEKNDIVHHQVNIVFEINKNTMQEQEGHYGIESHKNGYVSHSFNQLVCEDDKEVVSADHGDAVPRGIVVTADGERNVVYSFSDNYYLFEGYNYNFTGATLDALQASDNKYLTCGISVNQKAADKKSKLLGQTKTKGNVYLTVTDKKTKKSSFQWITKNKGGKVENPYLVKISRNRFAIMWNEAGYNKVFYQEINGDGKLIGKTYTYRCSRTKKKYDDNFSVKGIPVVNKGRIVWFCGNYNYPSKKYRVAFASIALPNKNVKIQKPEVKKLENNTGEISIQWNKCSTADGYELFRKTGDGSWEKIATLDGKYSYIDSNVENGQTYHYTIRAYRIFNKKKYSAYNKTGWKIENAEKVKLGTIRNVDDGLEISFKECKGADQYNIYRKTETSIWQQIDTISAKNGGVYVDKNVKDNEKYYYTVQLVANDIFGEYDNDGIGAIRVATPVSKEIKSVKDGLTITFQTTTKITYYEVYRQVNNGKWEEFYDYYDDSDLEHGIIVIPDETVSVGNSYSYKIKADVVENAGNGIVHSSAESKAITGIFLKSAEILETGTDATGINLSWKPVAGAEEYKIWRYNVEKKDAGWEVVSSKSAETTSYHDEVNNVAIGYLYQVQTVNGENSSYVELQNYLQKNSYIGRQAYVPMVSFLSLEIRNDKICLEISNIENMDYYYIYRKNEAGEFEIWESVGAKSFDKNENVSWYDELASRGKNYSYKISGYYNGGGLFREETGLTDAREIFYPELPVETSLPDLDWMETSPPTTETVPTVEPTPELTPTPEASPTPTPIPTETPVTDTEENIGDGVNRYVSAISNDNGIQVGWNQVENVLGYGIYRKLDRDDTYEKIATVTAETTSYLDETPQSGEIYYYGVAAKYENNYSGIVWCTNPVKYMNVSAAAMTAAKAENGVLISWSEITGADRYMIYRETVGETRKTPLISNLTTTYYLDTTVEEGKTYRYYLVCESDRKLDGVAHASPYVSGYSNPVEIIYN